MVSVGARETCFVRDAPVGNERNRNAPAGNVGARYIAPVFCGGRHICRPYISVMLGVFYLFFIGILPINAQTDLPERLHPRQVFIERDVDSGGRDRVIFVDLLTGEEFSVTVAGERYTVLQNSVMYFDSERSQVMLLLPNGTLRPHPFIQKPESARRIDWIVAADGSRIAWTITEGTPNALVTRTYVANAADTGTINGFSETGHEVFVDAPRDGVRAFPVAFNDNGSRLYMDYQPDAIGDFAPLRQYAGLFALDLTDSASTPVLLPGEPGCFCGAGIGAGRFVRLALRDGLSGFDVRVTDLNAADPALTTRQIAAISLVGFTQNGDVLIAPDGARAVYSLAQIRGFGTAEQSVQMVFILVDLVNGTQRTLTQPSGVLYRPIAWTEDSSAILVTTSTGAAGTGAIGTWKIDVNDGSLRLIASAAYLGTLIPTAAENLTPQ